MSRRDETKQVTVPSAPRRVFIQAALASAAATSLLAVACGDDSSSDGTGGGASGTGPSSGTGPTSGSGTTTASGTGAGPASSSSDSATGSGTSGSATSDASTSSGQGGAGGAGPASSTGQGGGDAGGGGTGGATPACDETEDDIEGPYYTAGAPFVQGELTGASDLPGLPLRLSGRVYSAADCTPLANAVLDIWQANDDGAYDNVGFTLRGKVRTDEEGRYQIDTIVPGNYLNGAQYRPAHIHVKASADGHQLLTTQLYFPDDPYNDIDPWFDERLLIDITPGEGLDFGAFDFVIVPA